MKLSVHMLVLNAAGVIERALRSVALAADEICIVDTGSSDGTPETVKYLASDLGRMDVKCIRLRPSTHPWLYLTDEPSSWKRTIPGPFTGLPVLRDWAEARNRGLAECRGDWILKLDADDECMNPKGLLQAVHQLSARPGIDYLVCPYEIMGVTPINNYLHPTEIEMITYQDRLWRNKPDIRFHFPLHERLLGRGTLPDGKVNWLLSAAGLRFRDWRDSTGLGVRIHHRNFKVLLAARERLLAQGRDLEPTSLLDLGHESIGVDPAYALEVLGQARDALDHTPEWHMNVARARWTLGDLRGARSSYLEAIEVHPRMAAPRLALGLLELEMGHEAWRATLREAVKRADEGARFDVYLPDLMKARKLLETSS
jgi:glycosyltransferase involved in cell wall biosynthesis